MKAIRLGLMVVLAVVSTTPLELRYRPAQAQPQSPPASELRGVWLTANDMPVLRDRPRMQQAIADLAQLNVNTLYIVVWNDGMAYYPSAVVQQRGIQNFEFRGLQGQDVLADLASEAQQRGLLVIPWFEFGFMVPPDSDLARRHPDWLTRQRNGALTSISAAGEVAWLNPFRPEVQQLITDLVVEVLRTYPVDGIQFDDHMSLPRAFGYDPFTTALYSKETGKPPPANEADPAWVRWRADKITAFMARLKKAMQEVRPGSLLSVSPNYYDHAYKLQLQDWLRWVRLGIADELLIQIYRDDLESFVPHLNRPEVQESRAKLPVAMAVMAGQRSKPAPMELITQQVEAARASGLGIGLFYFESLWSLDAASADSRKTALAALFATAAPRRRGAANAMNPMLPEPQPLPQLSPPPSP